MCLFALFLDKMATYICTVMIAKAYISNNENGHSILPSPNGSPYTYTPHTSEPALREAGSHSFVSVCVKTGNRLVDYIGLTAKVVSNNSGGSCGFRSIFNADGVERSGFSKHAQQERKKKCE